MSRERGPSGAARGGRAESGPSREPRRLGAVGGGYAVLGGNFLLSLFIAAAQIMPASVLTPIMGDLGVSPSAAGLLVSLALLSPALLALPVGYTLDRVDNRAVLLLGTVLVVGTNLWAWDAALAGAFPSLLVARFATGVGIIMTWTAGANMVTAAFSGRHAATATGVFTASAPLGYVVGQALPPVVAGWWGWEANFPVFAAASAAAFAAFALTAFHTASSAETERRADFGDFRRVLTSRAVWFVAAMSFVAYSLNLFFNSWMPTYLTDRLGYTVAQSGLLVALFPAMGVLARTSGGLVSDRALGGRRRPVPLLSFLVTVPLVVVLWAVDVPAVVVAILVLAGFSVQLGIGIYYTYIRELVEARVAGSAIAVLSMASFGGGFVAPVIAGWLIERTGAYLTAFLFAIALAVAGVGLAVGSPEPKR